MYSVMVGGKFDFDQPDLLSTDSAYTADGTMSSLQLYDVALTQTQIKKTMRLYKTSGKSNNLDCVNVGFRYRPVYGCRLFFFQNNESR